MASPLHVDFNIRFGTNYGLYGLGAEVYLVHSWKWHRHLHLHRCLDGDVFLVVELNRAVQGRFSNDDRSRKLVDYLVGGRLSSAGWTTSNPAATTKPGVYAALSARKGDTHSSVTLFRSPRKSGTAVTIKVWK